MALQVVQLTGQLEALQQEHHRLTASHVEQEKQNVLLQEDCVQLQVGGSPHALSGESLFICFGVYAIRSC